MVLAALAEDPSAVLALCKHIPAGICVYDLDARPLLTNDTFAQIVGSNSASGQPASPLLPLLARARTGESVLGVETEWPNDSTVIRAQVSAVPVRRNGAILAIVVLVLDSSGETGQRETLGIVGHDLRNPLAAIRMTAQLLARPDEMTAERRLTLSKRILTSASRMDAIVKSLVDYARVRAGALVRLEPEPMDLEALATRVIEEQTANVTGRSIELRREGDVSGCWDPGRLEQILAHLVSNALRHGADGTSVVTLRGLGDRVEIIVHNPGPAIPPELLPRLFDPFWIGPRPAGTPRRNIGLGLFIVRQLTAAHGGEVSAQSNAGAGTRFTVSLPRTVTPE